MKAKIDLEKFICSLLGREEKVSWRIATEDLRLALQDQGLECMYGEIVKIVLEKGKWYVCIADNFIPYIKGHVYYCNDYNQLQYSDTMSYKIDKENRKHFRPATEDETPHEPDFIQQTKCCENERIRKALIDIFSTPKKDWRGIPTKDILDWLEKQCEKPKKVSIWKHWKDGIAGGAEGEQIFLIKIGRVYSVSSCLGCECDYIELSELDELMREEKQGKPMWSSLKPQNRWKPSDEQIKAIRLARSFVVDDFGERPTLSEILMELEEQLQKIKENKL